MAQPSIQDLRPVIAAAKKANTLPDSIRRLPYVDHATNARDLTLRVMAARLGYKDATGYRTVASIMAGSSR